MMMYAELYQIRRYRSKDKKPYDNNLKTFLTAIFCVIICILKPETKIIIAAGQKGQAMKIVTEKIPELINMSKTGMLKREIKGSIRTSMNTDDPNVEFMNGSWIKVVAANQGARSARANLLILDEFRMIDPSIYRNVLRRFLAASRQPRYLDKDEYKNKQEYLERNKEIFLTSAYYKFNWSYERFKVFLKAMKEGRKYFVAGFPYQIAIKENLTNKEQLIDELSEDDIDEVGLNASPLLQKCNLINSVNCITHRCGYLYIC